VYPGPQSLSEFLEQLPHEDLELWLTEYAIEPWGDFRVDLAGGVVASTMAGVMGTKRAKPIDFMPLQKAKAPRKAKSMEDLQVLAIGYTRMFGGQVKDQAEKKE
jgi:hypothetical protein